MKAHVGTDVGCELVHDLVVTDAAALDSQLMDKLLHGNESATYGDKAYADEGKRVQYESHGIEWLVSRKVSEVTRLCWTIQPNRGFVA